ncbi:MAG TPA: ABC transporter ATP-binding protein [Pirellulales bacterium]|nr:ABC transporter ATP-binding protein [Pirellulales bacterium]
MAELLLEVRSLRYAYRQRQAVKDASFTIFQGENFGFIGPNGAGKTTTISCISGLLAGWDGEMRFQGTPFVPAKSLEDRRKLGVVPQNLALYENLSARENLEFFGRLNGLSGQKLHEAVIDALKLAGLTDRANDRVREYSGGMKRRLNLAVGVIHRPKLLLLDEPTVGVDAQSRNQIFDALFELRRTGHTLLYTTHYMEEAQRLCDRVAIMNDGRVIALGTPNELAVAADLPTGNLEEVFLKLTGRSLRDE